MPSGAGAAVSVGGGAAEWGKLGALACGDLLVQRCAAGDARGVLQLLEAGAARPDAVDGSGEPALCAAARAGSVEAVSALLAAGLDPLAEGARSAFGENALHAAARASDAAAEGAALCAEALAQHAPGLLEAPDARGLAPLEALAKGGNVTVLTAVLRAATAAGAGGARGAGAGLPNTQALLDSALWEGAKWGRAEAITLLCQAGANPRAEAVRSSRGSLKGGGESALDAARAAGDRSIEASMCEGLAYTAERRAHTLESALLAVRDAASEATERAESAEAEAEGALKRLDLATAAQARVEGEKAQLVQKLKHAEQTLDKARAEKRAAEERCLKAEEKAEEARRAEEAASAQQRKLAAECEAERQAAVRHASRADARGQQLAEAKSRIEALQAEAIAASTAAAEARSDCKASEARAAMANEDARDAEAKADTESAAARQTEENFNASEAARCAAEMRAGNLQGQLEQLAALHAQMGKLLAEEEGKAARPRTPDLGP